MGNVHRWGCVRFHGDEPRPDRGLLLVRMSVVMVAQSRVGSVTMTVDTSSAGDAGVGAGAEHAVAAAVAAGESVLSRRFGSAITLVAPEDLAGSGPATVVRATSGVVVLRAAAHAGRQALPGPAVLGCRPVRPGSGQLPAVHGAGAGRADVPGAARPRRPRPRAGAGGPRPHADAGGQALRPRLPRGRARAAVVGPFAGPPAREHGGARGRLQRAAAPPGRPGEERRPAASTSCASACRR